MEKMKLNIQLFGHTNSTENYELPQFVGTDKPTWLGDFNTAMASIDSGMSENASDITSLGTRVTNAEGVASQASSDVSAMQTTVTTLAGNVSTATSTANNAQSTATSALNTANTADGKADSNTTKIGTLSSLTTTDKTDLVSAINEVVSNVSDVLSDLVYVEDVLLATGVNVNANATTATATYTLTPKAGYTPILVTNHNMYSGNCHMWYSNLTGNSFSWRIANTANTNATNLSVYVYVLYIKTSAIYVES